MWPLAARPASQSVWGGAQRAAQGRGMCGPQALCLHPSKLQEDRPFISAPDRTLAVLATKLHLLPLQLSSAGVSWGLDGGRAPHMDPRWLCLDASFHLGHFIWG